MAKAPILSYTPMALEGEGSGFNSNDYRANKLNAAMAGLSGLDEQGILDLYKLYQDSSGSGKTFTSGGSTLSTSGVNIDPAVLEQQQSALGLAQTSLGGIQGSRQDVIGDRAGFLGNRTKGLRESIAKQGENLSQRLEKTGVTGEFGKQTKENFEATAKQKLDRGEMLALDEFNALSTKFDLMEGGAAELLKSIDITQFSQELQARGLSQELTSKLTRIAQGKDAISSQESAQDEQMLGNIVMAASMFSDRRLKRDIKKIGEFKGLNIYSYIYIWGEKAVGFMADEVKKIMPDAVIRHNSGFDMVNYSKVLGEM